MKFTYYGHSCFAVEVAGCRMVFDPFVRPNDLAKDIDLPSISADIILLSHGHFDHVADAVELAKATQAPVVANFEICSWLGKLGLGDVRPMNLGGAITFGEIRIKMIPALHSSVLPDGSNGGSPGGYLIEGPGGAFYFTGDTALTLDMKLVGESASLQFAVLPIGDVFTMGAADAAKAAGFLGCRKVVGVHYDTFPPIVINRAQARAAFESAGVELLLPAIGATIEI
ncbi:MAG: metal-dependent hydrolase [Terrimicrobiaceae bacterium]